MGLGVDRQRDYEHETLQNLATMVNQCEDYGIPVMAVTAVGKEMEKREARYLALCCRICAELGASVVKTYWCEDFEKVVDGCPVSVVIAGGPRCETELEMFEFVYDGMRRGAIGVSLGLNVWQNANPVAMVSALETLIHEEATLSQALDLSRRMKSGQS